MDIRLESILCSMFRSYQKIQRDYSLAQAHGFTGTLEDWITHHITRTNEWRVRMGQPLLHVENSLAVIRTWADSLATDGVS